MVGFQPVQPEPLARPRQARRRFFRQAQEILGVTPREGLTLFGGQMLHAELAQGFEQAEAPFLLGVLDDEQGTLPKLGQKFQGLGLLADRFRRFGRAASKDGQAGEEAAQVRRQQVMAPFQGCPERAVPRPLVPAPTGQQGEALRQALLHLSRRQGHRPRRHQFDGEWNAFQGPAQRGHGGSIARGELEVGPGRLRPVYEELCAGGAGDLRGRAVRIR